MLYARYVHGSNREKQQKFKNSKKINNLISELVYYTVIDIQICSFLSFIHVSSDIQPFVFQQTHTVIVLHKYSTTLIEIWS